MGTTIGISNTVDKGSKFSWSSYWKSQDEVLFFSNKISLLPDVCIDEPLYNDRIGATDYLVVNGTRGSYTFQCPNTAPYIAADTDYIWFKTDESQRTTTEAELIGYDLQRTPVKYDDDAPNSIRAIMILNSDITGDKLGRLHSDLHLPLFWSGVENENGYVKSNRRLSQSVWTPESVYEDETVALIARFTGAPTEATKALYNKLIKDGKDHGWWAKRNVVVTYCGFDAQASLLNLKADEFNHTLEGATPPTLTPGQYVQGDGSTGYIRTHFIPATNGGALFTKDANSWGFGLASNYNNTNKHVGARGLAPATHYQWFLVTTGINQTYASNNSAASAASGTLSLGTTVPLSLINERLDSGHIRVIKSGVEFVASTADNSSTFIGKELYICAYNLGNDTPSEHHTHQYTWFVAGNKLTDAEYLAEHTDLEYFRNNILATL